MGYKMKGSKFYGKGNQSPLKQEGPINKQNESLMKGEHPETWVYPGKNKQERIIDYESRAEFARDDAWSQREGSDKQKMHKANAKKLQHEADIIKNRKPDKKK